MADEPTTLHNRIFGIGLHQQFVPEPVQVSVKVASESPASVVNLNGVFVLFDLFGRFQVEIFGVSDVLFGKVPVVGPDNFVFDLVVFGLDIIEQGSPCSVVYPYSSGFMSDSLLVVAEFP